MSTSDFEVVVIGSGSAGLTAATVAAQLGLKTLLIEKSSHFGGTTAWSGGNCWVPANAAMKAMGFSDSIAEADRYATGVLGHHMQRGLFDAFLQNCNAMIDFLAERTHVRFTPLPVPDWFPCHDGAAMGGRALAPLDFDGRELGPAQLRAVQPPLTSFNAPMGMMVSLADLSHVTALFRSVKSFSYIAGIAVRYAIDRLCLGRGARLTMGNALVGRLLKSAADAGVTLWRDTPASALVQGGDRVNGVVIHREGKTMTVKASRGVVLASGGAAADPVLRGRHADGSSVLTLVAPGNVGDGLRMAKTLGGVVSHEAAQPFVWAVLSSVPGSDSPQDRCLHFLDMGKPGRLIVDAAGKRFGNEATPMFPTAMRKAGVQTGWLVADERSLRIYGIGLVWPHAFNLASLKRRGYVVSAPTLEKLAQRIGVDAATLGATVERFNRFADRGEDPDFGRGASPLDLAGGDLEHTPNASLGPLRKAPFHAVKVHLGNIGETSGLRVDAKARVLDRQRAPIKGLYACGMDMASLWSGVPMGPGSNHAHNMTFAYIAARDLAEG
jgi:succinate dehydrogenase/fumarate reductase flavoprotein subunit